MSTAINFSCAIVSLAVLCCFVSNRHIYVILLKCFFAFFLFRITRNHKKVGIVCRRSSCCCLGNEKRITLLRWPISANTTNSSWTLHTVEWLYYFSSLFSFWSIFVPEHGQSNTPLVWHDNLSFFTLDLRFLLTVYYFKKS